MPAGTCNDFARFIGFSRRAYRRRISPACSGKARSDGTCWPDEWREILWQQRWQSVSEAASSPKTWEACQNSANAALIPAASPPRQLGPRQHRRNFLYGTCLQRAVLFGWGFIFQIKSACATACSMSISCRRYPSGSFCPCLLSAVSGVRHDSNGCSPSGCLTWRSKPKPDIWPQADGEADQPPRDASSFAVSAEKAMIVAPLISRVSSTSKTSWERTITIIGIYRSGEGTTQLIAPRIDQDKTPRSARRRDRICTRTTERVLICP